MLQCRICMFEVSHLGFLFHFEELGHVGEIFLIGFSHLLLCSLWAHDLQALQTRADKREMMIKPVNALLLNWFLPEEEWKLHWSWFLRSDLWLWTSLRTSCSASATFSVMNDRRYSIEDHEGKKDLGGGVRKMMGSVSVYLHWLGDPRLGGLVDLSLPDSAAAALPQLTQTEAQILLIGVIFDLQRQWASLESLRHNKPKSYVSLCANVQVFFITPLLTFNQRLRTC